jgi:hypothetical protein
MSGEKWRVPPSIPGTAELDCEYEELEGDETPAMEPRLLRCTITLGEDNEVTMEFHNKTPYIRFSLTQLSFVLNALTNLRDLKRKAEGTAWQI